MTAHPTTIPHFNPRALDSDDFARFVPEFLLAVEDTVVGSVKKYLLLCDEKTQELVKSKFAPLVVHHIRAQMIDRLVTTLFEHYRREILGKDSVGADCALVAVGGFGRSEMAMFSDIDLLMLYELGNEGLAKPLTEKILYVLWDAKLEVGHAVRTIAECKAIMREDQTVFTAMLDARLLSGNTMLFQKLIRARAELLSDTAFCRNYFKEKIGERETRLKKFGGTVYLLEPHIKEGEGALRDLHFMRWFAFVLGGNAKFEALSDLGLLDDEQVRAMTLYFDYLLDVRSWLHLVTHRKGDQLNFDTQNKLAAALGFEDDSASLAVEKFMQIYYTTAAQVNTTLKMLIQKINARQLGFWARLKSQLATKKLDHDFKIVHDKIAVCDATAFEMRPQLMMKLFEHVQTTGLGLHFATKELVLGNLFRVNDEFRKDPEVCAIFRRMMANYHNLGRAFMAMHEVQFFDTFIAEFRKVRNRVQHDLYHVFTVDTHSIFALGELNNLLENPDYDKTHASYKQAMLAVKRRDLLSLGLLFHDIGKGEGGNHSIIGAEIANRIMTRLGYNDTDRSVVEFLVLSHLLMPHLSQRRDLEDFGMVSEFAKSMGSMDRLNMLYVLTWADIRAVSAEAWTEWKGTLLSRLYDKTCELIQSELKSDDYVQKRVSDVREALLARLSSVADAVKLQTFLKAMSPRYVLAHTDAEILAHFNLISPHDDNDFLLVENEISQGSASEILIYTFHNPRVFPLVTGVMLSLDINILTMENFVLTDGHVFIRMRVQSAAKHSLKSANLMTVLKRNMKDVFTGAKSVDDLIAKRKQPQFMMKKAVAKASTRVSVDNDVSAYYTVIDVFTHDRLGLLYDIVKCLVARGCYVDVSKISTKVEQVVDTFYVKDIFGHKITSKEKIGEIKKALVDVIDGALMAQTQVCHPERSEGSPDVPGDPSLRSG